MVFGTSLEELLRCNCGRWKPPTVAQAKATRARMERLKLEHHN
jgi:hypothetical protein